MTTKGSPAIICEDVKKWFGNFQALSGVTTSVDWGEVVVVIGLPGPASPPSSVASTASKPIRPGASWWTGWS